ncbi:Cytochrome c [Anatilimnocola aggregata]|uniref:Cytochrome c n=1 Tax=Anatilimnocola aggregata TaxID=2528021 RepID=A0A517YD80_9BACT|nr:PVC-type heme-binding CxxCH protein [Anatilimnocola aggregata]QDU28196.1 Cytochrome c [Anatilimnocola aggregata]
MSNKLIPARLRLLSIGLLVPLLALALFSSGTVMQAQQPAANPPRELEVDEPLPPLEAARTMVVPAGFQVTLFAGEPDVQQPIGFCIDDRGRLWVAEAYNYPHHGTKPGDRILIFEDTDNDGRFDKRTIFYDQLNYVTGIEVGFGGAWVMSPPNLYFIPDRDGDDQPDGAPQVLLDGFGNHANSHNLANGFSWGPDGWLYGTHGRTNWSLLGKPGTPKEERVRFDGGVYRYHPITHEWEPYADGTTNPWGIDWNDFGESFICNCVNPHLFHVIYGAHYEPWRNRESSQYAYQRIDTIADHLHFVGAGNVRDGLGSAAEDKAGGGHAHCGTMVYLGDNWPDKYRNTLFTNNIHGRRINNDLLRRSGSGYLAAHGDDLMRSKDPWYMGVTLRYGPDGSVFASDWSDTGECHSVKNTRRETGRIYKISYGQPQTGAVDFAKLSNKELVEKQLHRNDWHVQHARRLLQERMAAGQDMTDVAQQLRAMYSEQIEVPKKLRALWALQVIGELNDALLIEQLGNENEYIRAWAVRLLCEDRDPPAAALDRFSMLAAHDVSPLVRLHIASCLQRLKPEQRWTIAERLLQRSEDADDENLPLMIWYAIEPLVNEDAARFVSLAGTTELPLVARFIGRRIAGIPAAKDELAAAIKLLGGTKGETQQEFLTGIITGLEGRRSVPMPESWPATFVSLKERRDDRLLEQALQLALIFDDPTALELLKTQAADEKVIPAVRNRALQALVAKKAANVDFLLLKLAADPAVARVALRGLAEYENPETPTIILNNYNSLPSAARQDALQTLAARSAWAMKLVDALEANKIARSDVTAYTARQLFSLDHAELTARVKAVWGELRESPADKQLLVANIKRRVTPDAIARADRAAGRVLFQKTCANCHRFFDAGGKIGPDITGSQRTNLDYLLNTLIDPSAAVNKDYQMQVIATTSGRIITGLIVEESKTAITVQTVNEKIVVPADEIEERKVSPVSMMPDGLLQNLSTDQVQQLLAYLMGPEQVPLPMDDANGK